MARTKLARQLKAIPKLVGKRIEKAQDKNGAESARYMKALVPVGTDSGVRTRDTIKHKVTVKPGRIKLRIEAADDARAIEFINDQPFFYPVIRLHGKRRLRRTIKEINKGLKDGTR